MQNVHLLLSQTHCASKEFELSFLFLPCSLGVFCFSKCHHSLITLPSSSSSMPSSSLFSLFLLLDPGLRGALTPSFCCWKEGPSSFGTVQLSAHNLLMNMMRTEVSPSQSREMLPGEPSSCRLFQPAARISRGFVWDRLSAARLKVISGWTELGYTCKLIVISTELFRSGL